MPDWRSITKLAAAVVYLSCSLFGELVHLHQCAQEQSVEGRAPTCLCAHHQHESTAPESEEHDSDSCPVCQLLAVSADLVTATTVPDWSELVDSIPPPDVPSVTVKVCRLACPRGPPA